MSGGKLGAFDGTIARTIKDTKPWWPAAAKAPLGAPSILVVLLDDVGFSDFGCYGSTIRTPTIDRLAAEGLALFGLSYHGDVLDHAQRCSPAATIIRSASAVSPTSTVVIPSITARSRARRARWRNAARTRLPQLHGRYVARHALDRERRHRAVRRLAASARLRPLLRLPRCRDRSVCAELVCNNTHIDPPGTCANGYHLTADLVDQGDPFHRRPYRRSSRSALAALADLARARRLPRAAPGAKRHHQKL
jgi:hypothetical protein